MWRLACLWIFCCCLNMYIENASLRKEFRRSITELIIKRALGESKAFQELKKTPVKELLLAQRIFRKLVHILERNIPAEDKNYIYRNLNLTKDMHYYNIPIANLGAEIKRVENGYSVEVSCPINGEIKTITFYLVYNSPGDFHCSSSYYNDKIYLPVIDDKTKQLDRDAITDIFTAPEVVIHEIVHWLTDISGESTPPPAESTLKDYYNRPEEIKSFTRQIMYTIRNGAIKTSDLDAYIKYFMDKENIEKHIEHTIGDMGCYLSRELAAYSSCAVMDFWYNLTKENREKVVKEISDNMEKLLKSIKQKKKKLECSPEIFDLFDEFLLVEDF